MTSNEIFQELLTEFTKKEIATELSLHVGTVNRWIEQNKVPEGYYFDLCRLACIEVDYSKFSFKEKDQFFTEDETVKECVNIVYEFLKDTGIDISEYTFIEPSAGAGAFLSHLPENTVALDIEPRGENILQEDFLLWSPSTSKNIVIGNPPFGLRGNTALKFINRAATFSDLVCFILPPLFNSGGKGNCRDRVKGLNLIKTVEIKPSFQYPDGKKVSVNTLFQIWSKIHESSTVKVDVSDDIKVYSLSDGGTSSSTRNKNMLYKCDYYLPSTVFGEENMKLYEDFDTLPNRRGYGIVTLTEGLDLSKIDWLNTSFRSTNGAYNLRTDLIETAVFNMFLK